ncbi:hypothetical protein N6G95_09545 [Pediococcus inopinatus]|uniref:hypothetical protein n=1 Tax=Pediococcus inopinatus TaxID=114090 RepID=UPI002B262EB0|nr:hypothetical protein [Pediococcus inopinatus]WPC19446.1 hypothetical protein N6G95_09545 [Pediococcus inopinatus]
MAKKECVYCHAPFKPIYKTKYMKFTIKPALEPEKLDMTVDEYSDEVHVQSFVKNLRVCPVCGRQF